MSETRGGPSDPEQVCPAIIRAIETVHSIAVFGDKMEGQS